MGEGRREGVEGEWWEVSGGVGEGEWKGDIKEVGEEGEGGGDGRGRGRGV